MAELDVLLLRFDAPLMSFGGVKVDERGVTEATPGVSLVTGLVANALGYEHRDADRLARLQERLRLAVRRDRAGELCEDFQTVDLGQPSLEPGWTTWHRPAERAGANSRSTHIRRRHYWADAVFTVALALDPPSEDPDLAAIEAALDAPERPLFLGRKPCLPSSRLVLGQVRAASLKEAVTAADLPRKPDWTVGGTPGGRAELRSDAEDGQFTVWWPEGDAPAPAPETGESAPIYDLRDWANQIHTGSRQMHRSVVEITSEVPHDD